MIFSLDKALISFILSTLSLLFLPDFALLNWQGSFIVIGILGLILISCLINLRRYVFPLIYLLCFFLGLIFSHHQALYLLQQAEQVVHLPKTIQTEVRIVEILHQQEYQTLVGIAKLQPELTPQKIYMQWRLDDKPKLGEYWRMRLALRPISSRLNFSGFDRQQWLLAKGITASASVKSAVRISENFSWRQQWLMRTLEQTANLPMQGLLIALGFGERAWLKTEHWQPYQQTNTAHLIAISGLHIGLAMALGFCLMRAVQFLLPARKIMPTLPILAGLGLAWLYAELAGFAIPTLRALIALVIVYFVRLMRSYYSLWQLLLRVVALLLILDPMMLLSNSFWLSLGAVVSLILHYQYFPFSMLHWRGKALSETAWNKFRYFFALLHLQLGLLLFFTPVNLLIFNGFSLNSLWANLIAVPIYSLLLVPLVLFAILTKGAFHSWQGANYIAEKNTELMTYLQNQWVTISLTESYLIIASLALIFILLLFYLNNRFFSNTANRSPSLLIQKTKGFHLSLAHPIKHLTKTYVVTLLIGLIFLSIGIIHYFNVNRSNHWYVETLDVGQGLATLIIKQGRGILYDTGASWRGGAMAELEILPYLKRKGIKLDKLILSHDDNDHAGGVKIILQHYPSVEFIQASRKNYRTLDSTFCQRGLKWQWQGLSFEVLSPNRISERANNTDSCVVLISDGKYKVLLTGDADLATERYILPNLSKIDVLQVGHHGSNTSTGMSFLNKIQPQIGLISSGRWNPWGFPHSTVMMRLARVNSQVYNTAELGQIRLHFSPESIEVSSARSQFSPWYRRLIGLKVK